MNATVALIQKKRDGQSLTQEELHDLVSGYVHDEIPDYQMAAWLMSLYFQGMNEQETVWLTEEMAYSGEVIDLSAISGTVVDKHSTGGVGDTTSLVLAPLVASCGVAVAKMSGSGLGHTGGTIDKLSAIPGFRTQLGIQDFIRQVNQIGLSVISQSHEVSPADKKLYALRDVTATVESMPLIASSIMSKKIAAGAGAIVLDVKVGNGAFMKDLDAAVSLARRMVAIGKKLNKKTVAVISDMNQPLGQAIGNALEVKEAINVLKGKGSQSLTRLCLCLGVQMLLLGKAADSKQWAYDRLSRNLETGEALQKFLELLVAQGGDPRIVEHPELLPTSPKQLPVYAQSSGYVSAMDSQSLGRTAMMLGAGRQRLGDEIDLSAGLVLTKRIGEWVEKGQIVSILHSQHDPDQKMVQQVQQAISLSPIPVKEPPLIYEVITD